MKTKQKIVKQENINDIFGDYVVRILVEVKHYIIGINGVMIETHTEEIETNSSSISKARNFEIKNGIVEKAVSIEAKEIRLYSNTAILKLRHTIKIK